MASVVEILARLKADSSQFVAEMSKANQATASLDKAAHKTSSILGGKLKFGLFAAGAAAGATGVVTLASAYQVTGQTVVSGYGINTVVSGNTVTVNNIGVTGFNGLSGNVSMTGAGALVGRGNKTIDGRLATANLTGVASFNSTYLTVSNGAVSLASAYQVTGQTVVAGGSSQIVNTSAVLANGNGAMLWYVRRQRRR